MNRSEFPDMGIVIPCYNEEQVIPRLLAGLRAFATQYSGRIFPLFVDDGSTDRTAELLQAACAEDSRLAYLSFSRNFGHQTAVSAGLAHSRGAVVAVLDADLQDPIELLPDMLKKWQEGYDVVYGVRERRAASWFLRGAYHLFYRLQNRLAEIHIPLDAGDFSIMDRRVVDLLNAMPEHNRYVRGLRGWVGFKQYGLPYHRPARAAGTTKYNFGRLIKLARDGLVSFSTVPLRVAIWLGVLSASTSLLFFLYALYSRYFRAQTPTGWASLVILFLFFGGVQLFLLGVVGEYVGRIFEEVKNRPHYVINRRQGWVSDEAGG